MIAPRYMSQSASSLTEPRLPELAGKATVDRDDRARSRTTKPAARFEHHRQRPPRDRRSDAAKPPAVPIAPSSRRGSPRSSRVPTARGRAPTAMPLGLSSHASDARPTTPCLLAGWMLGAPESLGRCDVDDATATRLEQMREAGARHAHVAREVDGERQVQVGAVDRSSPPRSLTRMPPAPSLPTTSIAVATVSV